MLTDLYQARNTDLLLRGGCAVLLPFATAVVSWKLCCTRMVDQPGHRSIARQLCRHEHNLHLFLPRLSGSRILPFQAPVRWPVPTLQRLHRHGCSGRHRLMLWVHVISPLGHWLILHFLCYGHLVGSSGHRVEGS